MTFNISDSAVQELTTFFEGKEKATVRIYLAAGGCSGPRLGMALDEARDADEVLEAKGFKFCVEKDLYEKTGGINIDAGQMGFMVESVNSLGSGGGCAGCTSCG